MMVCVNCGRAVDSFGPHLYEGMPPAEVVGPFDQICFNGDEELRLQRKIDYEELLKARSDYDRAIGLTAAPEQLQALQEANAKEEGLEPGDPWRQPTGAHDAYPITALVTHKDKTWRSSVAANVWEPGVTGWVEEGEGVPNWVQPTGAHDSYPLGAIVRHNELVWQSTVDANVWEPPTMWTEISDPEA